MLLSIVIPAHNDEGSLRRTIDAIDTTLNAAEVPHEILVVDDHSTDGTGEVLAWLEAKYPSPRSVQNAVPAGFGNAVQTGLGEYRGDAVCVVAADGSDSPDDVVAQYRKLGEGYDCAFGSRFISGGKIAGYPLARRILIRLANLFIQLLFRLSYNDVAGSLKTYRRPAVDGIRPILSRHRNVAVELPLRAIVRGYSYAVVPVTWTGQATKSAAEGMGSRFLFSILSVLIEKLLARDDYRRVPQPTGVATPAPRWSLLPWIAFAVVLAVRFLFIHTYPLNDLGGDTSAYMQLLKFRRSNLGLAPGYPFLAGFPISFGWIAAAADRHPLGFTNGLLLMQHAVDLICLAIFMVVLARVYNRLTAVIAVVAAGVGLQGMGVVSGVFPEWLQGDLLILTISFALLAWRAATFGKKAFWYTLAFGAFTWSYIVKFNAAVLFPALLLAQLAERVSWAQRLRVLAIAAAFALVNYAAFVGLYHRPRTGTTDLSYDHSLVMMTRLAPAYGGRLPYPEGIATKRWLAFSGMLPPNYEVASAGMFDNLHAVADEVRKPYRAVAHEILTADEAGLDRILRTHPLPAKFKLGVSSIPISWFVGLKESDDLGVKVFVESVLHQPKPFIVSTMKGIWDTLWNSVAYPVVPTEQNVPQYVERLVPQGDRQLRVQQRVDYSLPYRYSNPLIWSPGYRLFSAAERFPLPHGLIVGLLLLGFIAALIDGRAAGWSYETIVALVLSIALGVFFVFSNAVLEFRWKEMRFALPMVGMLLGIAGGWSIPAAVRVLLGRSLPPRRSAAAAEP